LLIAVAGTGVRIPDDVVRALGGASDDAQTYLIAGVKGASRGALQATGSPAAALSLTRGTPVGRAARFPVDAEITATPTEARIRIQGEDAARVESGIALVVLDADGRVVDRQTFELRHGLTAALPMERWSLVQLRPSGPCVDLGDNLWRDVTAATSGPLIDGRIDNFQAFDASIVVYAGSDSPLNPTFTSYHGGCQGAVPCAHIDPPELTSESYTPSSRDERFRLQAQLAEGPPGAFDALSRARYVTRMAISANDQGQSMAFTLDLRSAPSQAFARARTDRQGPGRASLCALTQLDGQASRSGNGI
jgi:hypothetical protein